ncbi:MAG: hypothetical protein IH946_10825, partial [Bacteroidetes bacterium]|nr:hypothetical protein [Bacteroidota bacterium]
IRSTDGGKTWTTTYTKIDRMVWDIEFDPETKNIFAVTYSPFGSKLIRSTDRGLTWENASIKYKALYHDLLLDDEMLLVGGKNGKIKKNGRIREGANEEMHKDAGMIWSIKKGDTYLIATGSHGYLMYRSEKGWNTIQTGINKNLYESSFIDKNTIYVVGSNRTILKVKIIPPATNSTSR